MKVTKNISTEFCYLSIPKESLTFSVNQSEIACNLELSITENQGIIIKVFAYKLMKIYKDLQIHQGFSKHWSKIWQ